MQLINFEKKKNILFALLIDDGMIKIWKFPVRQLSFNLFKRFSSKS